MPTRKMATRLHMLSVREVMHAAAGDSNDGGGLFLRVINDRATWVFRYTSPGGKRREMGLGPCHRQSAQLAGESLRSARDLASTARGMLEELPPRDPIDARDKVRQDAAAAAQRAKGDRVAKDATLARVARAYHERFIEPRLSSAQSARWIGALERHVPPSIWHKPIGDVTRAELMELLLDLQTGLADTAQRVRRRLGEVFDEAIERGLVENNPVLLIRDRLRRHHVPRRVVPRPSLPYAEVPFFVQQLRTHTATAALCLEFVILTAARTGEAIGARWTEIDEAAALWTVPAERMKGGEAHQVALSPRALDVLRRARELGSEWVFPSPMDATRPLSNMAMLTLLKRMGRDDITVHGFRASFSTWANETDAARPDVIEACLAHREGDRIRAAYNRAKFLLDRRRLLLDWGLFVAPMAVAAIRSSVAAESSIAQPRRDSRGCSVSLP